MTDVMVAAVTEIDDETDLRRGAAAAARARQTAAALDNEKLLYRQSEQALADASTLVAAIVELRERLDSGLLGSDARYDVGSDLYDLSSKVQSFALGVFNA